MEQTAIRPTIQFIGSSRVRRMKRTMHFYLTNKATGQMYCVNCGANVIRTAYGEGARQFGSKELQENEVSCVG